MSDNVVRLATSQQRPVRACGTCALLHKRKGDPFFWQCRLRGTFVTTERTAYGECGVDGLHWVPMPEAPPRQKGIFERMWIWLFGGAQ